MHEKSAPANLHVVWRLGRKKEKTYVSDVVLWEPRETDSRKDVL